MRVSHLIHEEETTTPFFLLSAAEEEEDYDYLPWRVPLFLILFSLSDHKSRGTDAKEKD